MQRAVGCRDTSKAVTGATLCPLWLPPLRTLLTCHHEWYDRRCVDADGSTVKRRVRGACAVWCYSVPRRASHTACGPCISPMAAAFRSCVAARWPTHTTPSQLSSRGSNGARSARRRWTRVRCGCIGGNQHLPSAARAQPLHAWGCAAARRTVATACALAPSHPCTCVSRSHGGEEEKGRG